MHVLWQLKLAVLSPLSTKFTSKRFLVGVRHHVSAQVFLVLGGKATVGTLVRAQIGMLLHVSLEKKHESHSDRVKVRGAFEIKKNEDSAEQFERLTFTSGQEVEVKSQSGHLKVLESKCALLWFSMSERPWKDSMHIRQENLLVLRLGEPPAEGEAGASLLSWHKTNDTVKKSNTQCKQIFTWQNNNSSLTVTSTCCKTPSGSAEVR